MIPSRLLVRLLLTALALLLATCLSAASAVAEEVQVRIKAIYAHNTAEPQMDSELEPLAAELRSGFSGYNAFEYIGTYQAEVPQGESRDVELPDKDGSVLQVGFPGRVEKDPSMLRIAVGLRGKIAAEVKATPGSTFFQAGLIYKDGILVLAIGAEVSGAAAAP